MQDSLKTSGLQRDFELVGSIETNRVQDRQLKIVHKKSGIHCLLRFDSNSTVVLASKLVRDFLALNPICKLS